MKSWHAQAAVEVKAALRQRWPRITFAVTSDRYSVNARWTDGPTAHDVEQVMYPWTNGSFDGMTDCFNYHESTKENSVNYVFASRDYSTAAREHMRAVLAKKYGLTRTNDNDDLPQRQCGIWTVGQIIDHELQNITLGQSEADEINDEDLEAAGAFYDRMIGTAEEKATC